MQRPNRSGGRAKIAGIKAKMLTSKFRKIQNPPSDWSVKAFGPSPALAPYFRLYHIGKVLSGKDLSPVFYPPCGYARIVLSYQKMLPFKIYEKPPSALRAAIVGQYHNYVEVNFPAHLGMVSILVNPSAVYRAFGFEMNVLTNATLNAEDVFGNSIRDLLQRLAEADSDERRIFEVEDYFFSKFKTPRYHTHIVDDVIGLMCERKGDLKMTELSDYFKCSLRFLEKNFRNAVGVSPKYMARVIQFNNVLSIAKSEPNVKWSDLTVRLGYYDQAHLINTFVEFTGKTLAQYYDNNNEITESHLSSERLIYQSLQ